jgi:His/Glu/Gln/Arg/opine family amino acid ABC transporter permease subunit
MISHLRKRALLIALSLIFILGACFMGGCSGEKTDEGGSSEKMTLEDLKHARLGILTGSVQEKILRENFPEADFKNIDEIADLVLNLQQDRIDGFSINRSFYMVMERDIEGIDSIDIPNATTNMGIAFGRNERGEALKTQMDEFIEKINSDGTADAMYELWMGEEEPDVELDYGSGTGENGTIALAISADSKPYAYMLNGEYVGYDLDLVIRFCEEYGYGLQIENMTFASILPGIATGKYDIAACGIDITPERSEAVLFSEPHIIDQSVMVIRGDGGGETLLESIADGFDKTFIREGRWQLILRGTGITLLITAISAAAGTALGFGYYLLSRTGNKAVLVIGTVYKKLISGLPEVVLLMILFYVIFAGVNIDGIWVACIGFAIIVGAFVYGDLELAVSGIDKGQLEGALALGYTDKAAFYKIILPQAMRSFIPTYQGELVSLLKSTAIVGYIAVEDLTKISDIIRSNTYEAFFPLIASSAIYFLLTWIIALVIGRVDLKFDWKRRNKKKILKGVKL